MRGRGGGSLRVGVDDGAAASGAERGVVGSLKWSYDDSSGKHRHRTIREKLISRGHGVSGFCAVGNVAFPDAQRYNRR